METIEFSTTTVSWMVKPITKRKLFLSDLLPYAIQLRVRQETILNGHSVYYWTHENVEQLKTILKNEK